jgi:hypothetical protein
MGYMASKRVPYQQFTGDRGYNNLGNPARWREVDKANLEAQRNVPIEMGDTTHGRYKAQQNRDDEQAYQKMSAQKKSCSGRR